jgi:hypothetical protein
MAQLIKLYGLRLNKFISNLKTKCTVILHCTYDGSDGKWSTASRVLFDILKVTCHSFAT